MKSATVSTPTAAAAAAAAAATAAVGAGGGGGGTGPRDWTLTNNSNQSVNDPKGRSWTNQSISGSLSLNSSDKYGSYAPQPISQSPDQWGKSASLRPNTLTEKNWGKHRTERANLDKRDKLIEEVIETERSYVHSLQIMASKYAAPLRADPGRYGVKPEQVAVVFESIEPIAAFHLIFLVELEKDRNPARTIIRFGDFLKMYTTFISSYDRCVRIIGQMRKSSRFTKFLDETRHDAECHGLDLMSYLIMPIQRIPRYELLLRELISCSETDADLNQAYDRIRYIAKHVNETQRHVENMMKLLEIQDRITNSELSFELLQPHRRLLKEGRIMQRTDSRLSKWKQRVLFLFSDILLWTSSSNAYVGHVDLSAISVKDHTKYTETAFRVAVDQSESNNLIWRCETQEECQAWRQAIDQAMQKLCEVLVSRLDEKDRERFEQQLNGDGGQVDKAEVLRQAKLSVRRKKYERQQGRALHQFMKEKLNELQQNTNIGSDEDTKSNLSSTEMNTFTDNEQ